MARVGSPLDGFNGKASGRWRVRGAVVRLEIDREVGVGAFRGRSLVIAFPSESHRIHVNEHFGAALRDRRGHLESLRVELSIPKLRDRVARALRDQDFGDEMDVAIAPLPEPFAFAIAAIDWPRRRAFACELRLISEGRRLFWVTAMGRALGLSVPAAAAASAVVRRVGEDCGGVCRGQTANLAQLASSITVELLVDDGIRVPDSSACVWELAPTHLQLRRPTANEPVVPSKHLESALAWSELDERLAAGRVDEVREELRTRAEGGGVEANARFADLDAQKGRPFSGDAKYASDLRVQYARLAILEGKERSIALSELAERESEPSLSAFLLSCAADDAPESARFELRARAVEKAPTAISPRRALAGIWIARDQPDELLRELDVLRELDPKGPGGLEREFALEADRANALRCRDACFLRAVRALPDDPVALWGAALSAPERDRPALLRRAARLANERRVEPTWRARIQRDCAAVLLETETDLGRAMLHELRNDPLFGREACLLEARFFSRRGERNAAELAYIALLRAFEAATNAMGDATILARETPFAEEARAFLSAAREHANAREESGDDAAVRIALLRERLLADPGNPRLTSELANLMAEHGDAFELIALLAGRLEDCAQNEQAEQAQRDLPLLALARERTEREQRSAELELVRHAIRERERLINA